jgi:hypothetical protein
MLFGARLGRLTKKDPTIEDQVMAVAATLVVKKRLEGDEVEAIMRSIDGRAPANLAPL